MYFSLLSMLFFITQDFLAKREVFVVKNQAAVCVLGQKPLCPTRLQPKHKAFRNMAISACTHLRFILVKQIKPIILMTQV